ncbi:CMRF35-like molecule 1 [Silurus meridionalis]|uniref:CMRF35-like molecule 1 n=1 Tax=Silurus meridionalis TaxID=175797 RepID=UPI001EEADAC5|nr:CMRF35-like molecule 1 [Silurus meridionalis]
MQRFLRTLSFFQVLICATLKSKAESVYTGTEGGSVDISCKYPDGYLYTPKYLCRAPCTSSDVLIKCEKADRVVSKGKYSLVNNVSGRCFSVTIKHLTLQDSGVYYCGLSKWGFDKLTKVKLTVSTVSTLSTSSFETTQITWATTVILSTADNLMLNKQASSTPETLETALDTHGQLLLVSGAILGLILCCVLAALAIFYRKKSSTHITSFKPPAPEDQIPCPQPEQEDLYHVYDALLDVYSFAGPARGDSSAIYSTIELPAPADNDCSPYSLVAPH